MILRAARDPHGLPLVEDLLARGISPNECASDGLTALQLACARDDELMVRELLKAGADTSICNFRKRYAIHEACTDGGHLAIAEMLLQRGAYVGVEDADGNTPLHTLLASRRLSSPLLIPLLLRAGAKVNATNALGFTPLHIACTQGHREAIEVLIAAGADVTTRCRQGTPISLCVWAHGNPEIISSLLRAGACIEGENLLHHMLRTAPGDDSDSAQLLTKLIELGCDIEEVDERGATPLHYAVLHRRTRYTGLLLGAGADPHRADDMGVTPIDLCRSILPGAPALIPVLALLLFAAGLGFNSMEMQHREALSLLDSYSPAEQACALRLLRQPTPQKIL